MTGYGVLLVECYIHHGTFTADPQTVVTVKVDPQTGRPPDVDEHAQPCTPEPGSVERSVTAYLCDPCIQRVNRGKAAKGMPTVDTSRSLTTWQRGEWPGEW